MSQPDAPPPGAATSGLNFSREQLGVLLCLAVLAGLAWLTLLRFADEMSMPEMASMAMPARTWGAADFALSVAMWVTMMVGMMLPSATPMILLFRQVARRQSHATARVALFTLAYVVVWSGFSVLAALLQYALEQLAWLSPMAMRAVPWLGGALLALAGVYQWMPVKQACLTQCRSPLTFLLRHPPSGWAGAWRLGLAHGQYCLGCCWALMGILFAVGVMNLLWVAALAVFVLFEKVIPGSWFARLAGAMLLGWGLAVWALNLAAYQ